MLSVLLEGESLFNDASSILLFQVFLKGSLEGGSGPDVDVATLLPPLIANVCYLTIAGAVSGLIMGVLIRWVYYCGCTLVEERVLTAEMFTMVGCQAFATCCIG
jgi:NhaP-type Na+/H+ or K+/H+ antiporter